MGSQTLPADLKALLTADQEPDQVLGQVLPALGAALACDRCFLYLRYPPTRTGKVAYCWRRTPAYPEIINADWQREPDTLAANDPLFAAALRAEPSIYVEDVTTADPTVVNREFEAANFGHRALVHAHLCWQGQLWGILQPCVFGQPRVWTAGDRALISEVAQRLTPLVVERMQALAPSCPA